MDLIGGVIFIWPPLFKTNIFSKYIRLLPGSCTRIMHTPWLIFVYDDRTFFVKRLKAKLLKCPAFVIGSVRLSVFCCSLNAQRVASI
ncbi:hypothetical protein A3860_35705 [Niastella vici]|uniref:Uncharacterized protein n=1 Tax=Niastella vici TaxID=1703345 RepID=A0A1V9FNE4_9BACT|nr:hypothetical protein A3860_35705 [Niastella vici]